MYAEAQYDNSFSTAIFPSICFLKNGPYSSLLLVIIFIRNYDFLFSVHPIIETVLLLKLFLY